MNAPELLERCTSREQLHAWIERHLNLRIPSQPVCCGHQSPMDYLWHAYREPAGDAVVWAPRGGGKTTLGAIATLLDLLHKPGCAVRILGGSLDQSLRMWAHLEPMVRRLAGDQITGRGDCSHRVALQGGSSAAVLTQSQRSVRGLRVQKLRCDEVELFKPDVYAAAQLSTRSLRAGEVVDAPAPGAMDVRCAIESLSTLHHPCGLMQDVITRAQASGTPVFKWCLLDVLESCPPERECAGCALREECGGRARRPDGGFFSIEDAITMKSRVSRAMWEAEMLCLRPSNTLCVFPEFKEEVHVSAEPPWAQQWQRLPPRTALAIDFGYAHPFVCLEIAYDDARHVFVRDEHTCSHMTIARHLAAIRKKGWPEPSFVACDCAGRAVNDQTSLNNVQLCRDEWRVVRTSKDRAVADGLEVIRNALCPALGEPTLCVHPRCVNMIRSFRSYRYERPGTEVPWKDGVNDHAVDALRYFYSNVRHDARARVY